MTGRRVITALSICIIACSALRTSTAYGSVLSPSASGVITHESGSVTMDASNTSQGYVMIKYSGGVSKIKVQISKAGGGETYTYDLNARSSYEVFPLTMGNGTYTVKVLENVSGNQYTMAFSKDISVALANQFSPFLYPNQYVNFTAGSAAVTKAEELAAGAPDQLSIVKNVYNYVIQNVSYDTAKANSVQSGYLPNVDSTLSSKKGICFDYAALMTAMLRSRDIPTKLIVGYTGGMYHAWIDVYLDNIGWVDSVIYFDGKSWRLMDPTFASSGGQSAEIQKYIGDGANYQAKYSY